ncbi:hypothetical protein BsWGS_24728 [Bradybaena similaris]
MAETTGNKKGIKRRRLAAPAEVSHEVDASNSLQHPRLLDNSGDSGHSPKMTMAAKRELTPSPPSPTGSLSAGRDNGLEVSYSADAGKNRTTHMTDIMLGESSHDVIKCCKTEDEHLLDAINSEALCEAVTLLQTRVHFFTPGGLTQALISACRRGHKLLVQTLIQVGANIEHPDENGNTPLLICAEKCFEDIVWFLVSRHANVNDRNSAGNTALILSVRPAGSTDLTRFLLEQQDVDIHHENQDGDTALNRATRFMDVDTMRLLLEKSLARTSDGEDREVHGIKHETDKCFFNSRAQEMKQEEIAAKAGLADVYEMLKEHLITGTSPLELAIKARDTKSLDIFLDCQWSSSSDKKRFVDRALVYMFPNFQHKGVKSFSDIEVSIVQKLLHYEADVNQVSAGTKLFSLAVEAGEFQLVQLMCTHGAELNINYYSKEQYPLCIAAKNGRLDLIELLLKYGADLDKCGYSVSALDNALRNDHTECAKLLIQRGAKMDVASALKSAVQHQRPNYMHFVFENYRHDFIDFLSQETFDAKYFLISAVKKGNLDIIGQILDAGVDVNEADSSGQTPLTAARNRAVAEFLIQRGADVNQMVNNGSGLMSQLRYVIEYRKYANASVVELCKCLIENGAMVNCRDRGGFTPLMMAACQDDCVSMIEMLLDNGADVTAKDNRGNTALLLAARNGCSKNTSCLLKFTRNRKSEINIQNNKGLTPLIMSVRKQHAAIVKELLEEGADVHMKDNNENAALHHLLIKFPRDNYDVKARDHFNLQKAEDILTSLLDAGSNVNCQNSEGLSPLMLVAKKCKSSLMSILLNAGANVNAICKNNHSQTAISFVSETLDIDVENDNVLCIESLLERGANSSYLSHECFHKLIFHDKIHVIPKLIQRGVGPADIEASQMNFKSSLLPFRRTLSPLCSALLRGHISLARYFMDILFLTRLDLSLFANKKERLLIGRLLIHVRQGESRNFLHKLSSQPMTLVSLCLVTVSIDVGSSPGRETKVDSLPLSQMMKDRLLFKANDDKHVLSEMVQKPCPKSNRTLLSDDYDYEEDVDDTDDYDDDDDYLS